MDHYLIKVSYPQGEHRGAEKMTTVRIKVGEDTEMIYSAVGWFEDHVFPDIRRRLARRIVEKRVDLRRILNIHNSDGLRDISQVKRMIRSISRGRDTLARSGMPNIKIFRTRKNRLFLFDGHHSMLAYMASGRRYLDSIPHLLIEHYKDGCLIESDISHFFGGLLSLRSAWPRYAVNWQAPKGKRLCLRMERNMGELFRRVNSEHKLYSYA